METIRIVLLYLSIIIVGWLYIALITNEKFRNSFEHEFMYTVGELIGYVGTALLVFITMGLFFVALTYRVPLALYRIGKGVYLSIKERKSHR